MEAEEVMPEVVEALTAQDVPYLFVGSFSTNFYGIPRSTKDLDIVVELAKHSIHAITNQLGLRYSLQPQIAFESVTGTTRYIVDVVGTQFKVEFFRVGNDPHDRQRFERRQPVIWLNRQVWLPTAEDAIITKLRWLSHLRRNKDYDDIRNVVSVQRDRLDWSYIERWCDQHGTRTILDEIRVTVPEV